MNIGRSSSFVVLVGLLGLCLIAGWGCQSGGHWQHYRFSAFEEARNRDMTIFLHFHNEKSEESRKQKEILEALIKDEKFKAVGAYRVQFKSEKDLESFAHVSSSPTLIVYKGAVERGRISNDLDRTKLKKLLESGL